LGVGLLAAVCAEAQPLVFNRAVVNAASYMAAGLPNGSIARGSMFTVFGRRLGPAAGVQVSSFPLPTTLAGVSLRLTQGATVSDLLPVFVIEGQINAIMPSNAPLGPGSLRVTVNGLASNPVTVRVAASSFGMFAANSGGFGPGVIQNFVSAESQPINSVQQPALPGQVEVLWGTGLGAGLNADNQAPAVGNLPVDVEVWVGGKQAEVLYSGRTSCCSAIDQVVFRVPLDAPRSCWVPVQVRTAGVVTSNTVTMAIADQEGRCTDAGNPFAAPLTGSGRLGVAALVRQRSPETSGVTTAELVQDFASVHFRQAPASPFVFHPLLSLPPEGSCTVLPAAAQRDSGPFLDGGFPFDMLGGGGNRGFPSTATPGFLLAPLSTLANAFPYLRGFFQPGTYTVSGPGGRDVGRFGTPVASPGTITWLNKTPTVERNRPLEMRWTGAAATDRIFVVGKGVDITTDSSASLVCGAPAGAGSMTIPARILSALPADRISILYGELGVASLSIGAFTATGLDNGFGVSLSVDSSKVQYR
jgi:uncharacterized protein (TIGR03437 family)